MDREHTVGVIGTGTMGSPMVEQLVAGDIPTATFDIDTAANEAAAQLGANVAESATAVAEMSEIVLMSLPMPSDVRDVVTGDRGILEATSLPRVVVDLSTSDPSTSQELAAACRSQRVGFLDAPVLGRPHKCGHWTLPIGGDPGDLEIARSYLSHLAARLVPVGDTGAGHSFKLLNNLLFGAINSSVVEAFVLAEKVGLDPKKFFTTVTESNAASVSNLLLEIGPKIIDRDWSADFAVDLLRKDIKLAIAMADAVGVPVPTARAVDLLNEWGHSAGLGDLDTSALAQIIEQGERPAQ